MIIISATGLGVQIQPGARYSRKRTAGNRQAAVCISAFIVINAVRLPCQFAARNVHFSRHRRGVETETGILCPEDFPPDTESAAFGLL